MHGLSYFSYDWIGVASELATGREVVAMDMRGFGDSTWSPSRDYGVPTMAADIGALLDHLGWPRTLLIGHSMGGRNCTYFTARNPAREPTPRIRPGHRRGHGCGHEQGGRGSECTGRSP